MQLFITLLLATAALARPSPHIHSHAHVHHAHRHADLKPIKGEMAALGPGGATGSDCCQGDMMLIKMPADWREEVGGEM
ncbi:hypothetical protein F5X68DRAFT_211426 [Plectosphaerella plurivora]|uniref:Uncharacterized protein n=1 Tax=Plectosphaerella plurivora TaxID=936078 RepID=A0A9P8V7Q5_9PEZI|nr:hypothetical protein F5X68DRAFT_211426 [Plectosphaerella plurivora]